MKKILGLDLGVSSIGWAIVNEAENSNEKSSIIDVGVRIVPLTTDEQQQFTKGQSITTNAKRTQKRSARRNLQRYKLRRSQLLDILKKSGIINDSSILNEDGKNTTHQTIRLRAKAASEQIGLCDFARILLLINKKRGYKSNRKVQTDKENGDYLNAIQNRSNNLSSLGQTIGQYQMSQIDKNFHYSFKDEVFYRQDYLDEFNVIWDTQAKYYSELNAKLKKEIQSIIFFQRPLRSQKGLVSTCEFEQHNITIQKGDKAITKVVGRKVAPISSPIFQEFRIWQNINNLRVNGRELVLEEKQLLANELSIKEKLSEKDILKLLFKNYKELQLNYKNGLVGNTTNAFFYKAYLAILAKSGHTSASITKLSYEDIIPMVRRVFSTMGFKTDFLFFNSELKGQELVQQAYYRLWHLVYSYQGDESKQGNDSLCKKISDLTGMPLEYASIIAKISYKNDYASLSSEAMRKILPYLKQGIEYSDAVLYAYDGKLKHSKNSLTKEEIQQRVYKDYLELLPKNSLRNPVVEKILNQMVNVVNQVITDYGKPDEIRIELARELKKNAKERGSMTKAISKSTSENEKYREEIIERYNIPNPSKNDIIKYRLYLELKDNGYRTLYSNTFIRESELFIPGLFEIEHIIPQALLFDDSFSNKTLETHQINRDKSNDTAYDFVLSTYGEARLAEYKSVIMDLFHRKSISKTKAEHLLMTEQDIPEDFISRELRDSQYIAKKAKNMLEELIPSVVTTTGSITDRLRKDWQLVDVMKELNFKKYQKLGKVYEDIDINENRVLKIKDWTKRNDHRHHAMDAITIAFTKRSIIQYLNNLNARRDISNCDCSIELENYDEYMIPSSERTKVVSLIQATQMYRDKNGKLKFIPPIPINEFRAEVKNNLDSILVSIKSKSKVMTQNTNVSKKKNGKNLKVQLTPRGELHKETIYGSSIEVNNKEEVINGSFTEAKIASVSSSLYRQKLIQRLQEFGNDPKKAFCGKNDLDKNPIYLGDNHTIVLPRKVKTMSFETRYTIRKKVDSELDVTKVVDLGIKTILEKRIEEFGGDVKMAFSNLNENPIWLNKEKGISIKRVTISGVKEVVALHDKKDHFGKIIIDDRGNTLPSDFVQTRNNHHIAIFEDSEGNYQEHIVSFYEATTMALGGHNVIDKDYNKEEGWKFIFSMKINDYFVLPDDKGFDPNEIDLMNPDNYHRISPHLFRVQKLTTKDYVFRHHLETNLNDDKDLRGVTWERIKSINKLKGFVKVRVDGLGNIVQVGEY